MNFIRLSVMILTPIAIGVVGQLFLKLGMQQIGTFSLMDKGIILQYVRIIFNPYVFFGLFFYFLSSLFWLYLISRVPLSFAYPMISISYILVALASQVLFHEQINMVNWFGILVIMIGVSFVAYGRG